MNEHWNHANPVQLLDLRVVWVHLYRNKFGLKCVRFRLCASLFCWMQEVLFFFIQLVILWRFGWRYDAADFNSWIIQMALISSAPCISFTNMSELVRHANPKTVSVNESLFGVKRVFFLCFIRYKNALHCFWLESPFFSSKKFTLAWLLYW